MCALEQPASTVKTCIHLTHALQVHRDKPTNKSSYFDLLHNTNVNTSNLHIPNKLCARHKQQSLFYIHVPDSNVLNCSILIAISIEIFCKF